MTTPTTDYGQQIAQFKDLLTSGLDNIAKACAIYVTAIDSSRAAKDAFIKQCPEIPPGAWREFELIGRGAMDYRLLWLGGRAQARIKTLPKSEQTRLLDVGVEVTTGDDNDKRIVKVDELSPNDVRMVFHYGRVRTPEEQRAWAARNAASMRRIDPPDADYYVSGGNLVIQRPTKIPLATLRRLVK